jgi:hypothetical protein
MVQQMRQNVGEKDNAADQTGAPGGGAKMPVLSGGLHRRRTIHCFGHLAPFSTGFDASQHHAKETR